MFKFDIKINGLDDLLRFLKEEPGRIEKRFQGGLEDIGKILIKQAGDWAPEDTGQLRDSIVFKVGKNVKGQFVKVYVPMRSKAGAYANKMNEGHYRVRNMKSGAGRQFMDRALSRRTTEAHDIMEKELNKTVEVK